MSDKNHTKNTESRCCSYCLLPPRATGKKLKRCSRCHRAWYHNSECQRNHFPLHKEDCRRWSAARKEKSNDIGTGGRRERTLTTTTTTTTPRPVNKKFVVQYREGRGKCLVALSSSSSGSEKGIRKGERIGDPDKKQDFWDPLIPPVLLGEYRTSRCALCFGRLLQPYSFDRSPNHPLYRLLFCSDACRRIASRIGLEREERDACGMLQSPSGRGPPRILPTAILLYRIMITEQRTEQQQKSQNSNKDALVWDQVCELQSKPKRGPSDNLEDNEMNLSDDKLMASKYHTQGVIATAMGMLQCSESSLSSQYRPSMEHLIGMVHRIKVNGFSITYEEDFERIGIGLYGIPSFMNHSCRPNALQTFLLRPGRLPSLYVTAFQDIPSQQEICISYTDTSCPSHVRQKRLEEDYCFVCNCEACNNTSNAQDDCNTMAIRCMDCCNQLSPPPCSFVTRSDRAVGPSIQPAYRCTRCNKTDFESTLRQLRESEEEMGNDKISIESNPTKLKKTFQNLKKLCYTESWYVQEAGDQLLQHYIEKLPMLRNDPEREQQTAWAALNIAEELLGAESSSGPRPTSPLTTSIDFGSTSTFLRYQHLRYKMAKLRLFLVPDPHRSVQELQQVLRSLEPYFSDEHPVISGLKACVANAML